MSAFLQITLRIEPTNRGAAADVFHEYRQPFLDTIRGARTKQLLVREDDVQVLHGFDDLANASAYLETELFTRDVVGALGPLLSDKPEVRVYSIA